MTTLFPSRAQASRPLVWQPASVAGRAAAAMASLGSSLAVASLVVACFAMQAAPRAAPLAGQVNVHAA